VAEIRGSFGSFAAAERYFRRKVNLPSKRWDDLMHGEHASGFMVAGVTKMAVLDDIRQAVDAAIARGETLTDFRKRFAEIIQSHGWPGGAGGDSEAGIAWRTQVIYHTNLRTAYQAGRWETLRTFPCLKYRHNSIKNPREQHRAWDGKIIRTDDPWWDAHYPPNGWGCRCTVFGVSAAEMRATGKVPDAAPPEVPGDPPPEWAYHVGRSARSLGAAESFGQKVMKLPPGWRDAVLDDAVNRQVNWFAPQWEGFIGVLFEQDATAQPKRGMQRRGAPVGFVPARVVRALESGQAQTAGAVGYSGGFQPSPPLPLPIIFGGDEFIAHVMRDMPYDVDLPARLDALKQISQWMQAQDSVYLLDDRDGEWALIVTRPASDGRWWKLVMTRKRMRMNRETVDSLHLTTLELMEAQQLDSYKVLAGER